MVVWVLLMVARKVNSAKSSSPGHHNVFLDVKEVDEAEEEAVVVAILGGKGRGLDTEAGYELWRKMDTDTSTMASLRQTPTNAMQCTHMYCQSISKHTQKNHKHKQKIPQRRRVHTKHMSQL